MAWLHFISRSAGKGRLDALATARNAVVDAWERLTTEPIEESERQYRLKGDLATGTCQGRRCERWPYERTDGAASGTASSPRPGGGWPAGC
jgi:hypothetical protein